MVHRGKHGKSSCNGHFFWSSKPSTTTMPNMTFFPLSSGRSSSGKTMASDEHGGRNTSMFRALSIARQDQRRHMVETACHPSICVAMTTGLQAIEAALEHLNGCGMLTFSEDVSEVPKSEYDEGMDALSHPVEVDDECPFVGGLVFFNIGLACYRQESFASALEQYRDIMLTLSGSPPEQELFFRTLFASAVVLYRVGLLSHSLMVFEECKKLAESLFENRSPELLACYNCLGVLHFTKQGGNLDAALRYIKLSLSNCQDPRMDCETTATRLNNLGRVMYKKSMMEDALRVYGEALRIRMRCFGSSVDTAATLFNIGQVHHHLGNQDKALAMYRRFLKMIKSDLGENHRDVCVVSNCIGLILHAQKKYQAALDVLLYALRIGKEVLGSGHPEMANTLNKLGNLYFDAGHLDGALKSYRKGLRVELATGDIRNACVTYGNIAEIYKQREQYDRSLAYYRKVLGVQEELQDHPLDICKTLSNISYVLLQSGKAETSFDANQECLRIRKEHLGDNHEDVASALTQSALILLKLDEFDLALENLSEAYRVRKFIKSSPKDIAFILYNIALVFHHMGSHQKALQYYKETAAIEKEFLGTAQRDLSITYYNMGQIHFQAGDFDVALDNFEMALSIEEDHFGEGHVTCAKTWNEIGNIELQRGNLEASLRCFEKSARIFRKIEGNADDVVLFGLSLWRYDTIRPQAAAMA